MRKHLLSLAMIAFAVPAWSQIPVTDVAANATLLQQALTAVSQLSQLEQQYSQMQKDYAAITGNYGRGNVGLTASINSSSVVPGSWQDVVNQQNNGSFGSNAYGQKLGQYEKQLNTASPATFGSSTQANTNYQASSNAVRSAMAGGDATYSELQTHLTNVNTLAQQIETTTNTKDATDLQNRMAAENAYIATAQAKVATINMNLQAQQLNQTNQGTAQAARFFGGASASGVVQ